MLRGAGVLQGWLSYQQMLSGMATACNAVFTAGLVSMRHSPLPLPPHVQVWPPWEAGLVERGLDLQPWQAEELERQRRQRAAEEAEQRRRQARSR